MSAGRTSASRTSTWHTRAWQTLVTVAALVVATAGRADAQLKPAPVIPAATRPVAGVVSPHGADLREPCASCHRSDGWKPARISPSFRHAERTFPLTGAHERVQCQSCHKRLDFQSASSSCTSCHTDPHKNEFGTTCARCHNTRSFVDRGTAVRTHQATRFPLRGAHAIATCEACHTRAPSGQAQFAARGTTCEACHLSTFKATQSPAHEAAHFTKDCTSCHTISSWGGASFDHNTTKFALTGRHQAATCQGCHSDNVFAGKSTTCVSCHQADYAAAIEPKHSPGFPTACESCHGTAQWKGAKFDHQTTTRFPLTGKHVQATCIACHKAGTYAGTPSTCVSCHQPDFDRTSTPPHKAAGFASTCEGCHTTATWTGGSFDHATTRFALTGGHRAVSCSGCHADNVFRGKPMACASCHQAKANATTSPHHGPAKFASTCESCHTTTGWAGANYDHNVTRFPLTGKHTTAVCLACHTDKVYAGKPTVCASCHQADYDRTAQPNHKTLGFPGTCETCHNTAMWDGATFDHSTKTRFELTGAHRTLTCRSCHADGVYRGRPMTCTGCHQAKYDATTSPHHAQAQFATACESCHTTVKWTGVPFDHSKTRFPLLGKHIGATCLACHSDRVYAGKPSVCVSCHQRDYDASLQPSHRTNGIPNVCESCHTVTAWKPASYDHNTTRFPLTGGHRAVNCQSCHADGVFRGKPTTCVSCHQAKFNATTLPNHRTSGFPAVCESCHTTTAWVPSGFDHANTNFPLTGGHRTVTCTGCHADNVFKGKPTACASCHQATFDATTSPHHAPARFATTCQSCHTTQNWLSATYDHSKTRFPLLGKHIGATCLACHSDRVYLGKPSVCVSCHQRDYDASLVPNHRTSGIPTVCETCHTATAWKPASYDHNTTRFPLTGAHRAVNCQSCHADGVYRGKPLTCAGCHQAKFDATTLPNHRTSGFPAVCESCHTTTAWTPATFDHAKTNFPLTGGHRTVTCAGCHADNVYKGKPTACASCHQTAFNATTNPHHAPAGFATTCQTCHTTTSWLTATFDHSKNRFPLVGRHLAATCLACHSDRVYLGKPTVCVACHQARYDAATNPNHRTSGFPTTCESCHNAVAWTPASFDHATTRFPLVGAHRAVSCLGCHADGVYRGKTQLCVGCHQAKYDATTVPNHRTSSFPTTCETCHTSTAWTPATFDHATTRFPLTGAHRSATCLACHADGVYRGKPMTCSSCHTSDYNATTNPNHRTATFPMTCESCHTTTTWTGATFNHDGPWFPIYSGKHRGKWTTCAQCHANSANYKEFTCLTCHTKSKTDGDHNGRNGYRYESSACYACHPRGNS